MIGTAEPPLPPHPATTAQINNWRREIRRTLFIPDPLPKLETQTVSSSEVTPGVTLDKVIYTTAYGLRIPADVFRPTHAPTSRMPAIVVVNGHGADKSCWYSYYTGVLYARAGAVVLTYDPIGEGERNDDHKDFTGEHDQLVINPETMPRRMGGLMITDAMQAVSYLSSRHDVDPHRIAVMGFSMGSFITVAHRRRRPAHPLRPSRRWRRPRRPQRLLGPQPRHDVPGRTLPLARLPRRPPRRPLHARCPPRRHLHHQRHRRHRRRHPAPRPRLLRRPPPARHHSQRLRQRTSSPPTSTPAPATAPPGSRRAPPPGSTSSSTSPPGRAKIPTLSPRSASATGPRKSALRFSKNYDRNDRDAGIIAIAADVPHLTLDQLDVLPRSNWDQRKSDFIYATWVQRAAAARFVTHKGPTSITSCAQFCSHKSVLPFALMLRFEWDPRESSP